MTTKGYGGAVKEKRRANVIGGGPRRNTGLCQRKRRAHPLALGAAAALAAASTAVEADVLSEMERFWQGAAVNTTGPTAFEGQASGHWTLGNLYLRAPVQSERIGTISLPSFRAGCGGIDAFAGAFSFIDSDQFVAFARGIAQNATGFAFELALETISPVIAETMSKLRALAQWVNNQSINSCEMAQSLVGAAWSTNDRASAAICAAIGTSQGIFSDYAAARHGCGAGGQRYSTLAAATGELEDQAPVNVNYAWEAVQGSTFLSADQALGEFAMSITGTVIVTAPVTDGSTDTPAVRVLEPLALDREVTEILMEGGGDLPVYACDTPLECLEPNAGSCHDSGGPGVQSPRRGPARGSRRRREERHRAAARRARAGESHHAAGLPGHQCRGRLPGRGDRPGSGRARRSGGARRAPGVDLGPAPDDRSPRGHARQRRRDPARTLAGDAARESDCAHVAPPGGA